jgi:alpha-ketoglutarate-dependent taurine dioxygenase
MRAAHANVRKPGLPYDQTDPPEPSVAEYDTAEGPVHPVVRLKFVTRFSWAPGSIAFWDNRQVWHFAVNDYQGQRRVMNCILLAGTSPVPA